MSRQLNSMLGLALLWGWVAIAQAGPIIIAGTDADDHGYVSSGVNQTGWLFMQKAFENLGAQVGNSNKQVVCIGCNSSQALGAFDSAFGLSSLTGSGWTSANLTSTADITGFFDGTGAVNVNTAGIYYMPTGDGNVSGGITKAQNDIVNANANLLNNFVASGGGLFTQDQYWINGGGGYGWLTTLLPGLVVHGDSDGTIDDSGTLTLTAAGNTAFPGLTNSDLSNATPWHDWFSGNFGGLGTLVNGPAYGPTGGIIDGAVVLGGGAGTVISCGQQGQPPCPTPEPESMPLFAIGALALLMALRRKGA
jgi:hypothetical protein